MIKNLRKIARELLLKWRCRPRYDLERKIFPKIKNKKVLFVGIAEYVKDYPKKLKNNELWTIDIDSRVAKFGGKKHIVGNIAEIDKYFSENFFDFIFLCGVIGCGLNKLEEVEDALKNCYKVLKKGGILIIGWDPISLSKHYLKIPLSEHLSNYKLFVPINFYNFPSKYRVNIRNKYYAYDFLKK